MSWLLVADIGGTNVRLRAYDGDRIIASEEHPTGGAEALADLFGAFSACQPEAPDLVVAAVAGPVSDNRVQLTNAAKSLCGKDLQVTTGAPAAYLINDFAAAAWATVRLGSDDLLCLQGEATPPEEGIHVVLGPGTGLGVGTLICRDGIRYAMPGEGGHVALAPHDTGQVAIFQAFQALWPEVFFGNGLTCEAEAMLSGKGLPVLYQAVQSVAGETGPALDARALFESAQTGTSRIAALTTDFFKSHLGRLAGDLALAAGAESVFLVGGVATKNAWLFDEAFVHAFNQGGRFTPMRRGLNLYLLRNPDFGLLGARNYAHHMAHLCLI